VIQQNELSEWALPISFFRLPDSVERRVFHCLSLEKHHLARMELVKTYLPPAENILDIGGAVDIHPEGALLAMGYPHRPRSITIVDLPDEEREFAKRGRRPINMTTASGTHVSYEFTNMTRLTPFQDSSFDLVWSGQSIEHLTQKEVDLICAQVFRVLRPGGYFCLDTPNRLVTQLISKNYLHPDHKFEYSPDQLTAKLEKAGFTTLDRLAVTPLPFSRDLGRVSKLEILKEARVGTNSLDGFSFYLKCQKPEV
jgi:SAM-dependent methyltransferase